MVAVVIIGVLAALVVPTILGRSDKARQAVAKQKIASLESAINLFNQDYGRFPDALEELTTQPADIADDQWTPPSLKSKDLLDPWGNPFFYQYPGEHWAFDLASLGADGQPGGENVNADITNWSE